MVSIGQKLSLQQSQLSLQKKTAQTENSTENNAVVNQASINESKGGNFVPLNQIDTGSLLANNGIKINRPDGDKSSQELNTNYKDYGDIWDGPGLGELRSDLESGFLQEGDRVKYKGMDGQVIMTENGKYVLFENGKLYGPGSYRTVW